MIADRAHAVVSESDEDLVARCRRGEAAAWERVHDRHADRLWRFVARMGVTAEAEDLVQEAFLVGYVKLGSFDGRVGLGSWLLGIAFKLVRQHRRREWRRRASRLLGLEDARPAPVDPERAVATREAVVEVDRILARMSERKRAVFLLYEVEGLEGPEIAAALHCSPHTVKSRLHHARADFQRLLRQGAPRSES